MVIVIGNILDDCLVNEADYFVLAAYQQPGAFLANKSH